jgi:hypothetical protein
MVWAEVQVSSAHWVPVLGQVPQRRLTVSLDLGGSMPSLIAATLSHGEVYEADGVADLATFVSARALWTGKKKEMIRRRGRIAKRFMGDLPW